VAHAKYITYQLAEVAVPRQLDVIRNKNTMAVW
jgi:hypothetical protein